MTYDAGSHASPHLLWSELACKDHIRTPYPLDWRESRGRPLALEFERIRAIVGQSIRITSAYRTPEHNAAVGGKPKSQHMQGRALDLECPHGYDFERFRGAVLRVAGDADSKIRWVCVYPGRGFIHIDIRPTEKLKVEVAHS